MHTIVIFFSRIFMKIDPSGSGWRTMVAVDLAFDIHNSALKCIEMAQSALQAILLRRGGLPQFLPLHDFLVVGCLFTAMTLSLVAAEASATVIIDPSHPSAPLADDYAGLSYETERELPDAEGKYYFRPDNAPLTKMFQTLGLKNLRIGGNMVDSSKVAVPTQADIDQLFGFAKAAGLRVIYSFRLKNGDAATSAAQAKYIADHYADNLACFCIGNEPDLYVHSYSGYLKIWQPIYDAINQVVPNAKFCGPSLTSNARSWAQDFARDYASSGKILYVTQHEYPGGPGGKIKDPAYGRDQLLSPAWYQTYQRYCDKFVPPLQAASVPYRFDEANNFYNGGAVDVSDTFASALWGLDYLYWWAEHGSQGINFHTGDEVAAGPVLRPCRYASFTSAPDGYFAHPLAYGIKLFTLGSHGRLVPATVTAETSAADLNLAAYAVLGTDQSLYVTLINKEHDATARDASVTIQTGSASYTSAQTMVLASPQGDDAAKEGVTLGGETIHNDGSWQGKWTDLPVKPGSPVQIKVPACSALLIHLIAR